MAEPPKMKLGFKMGMGGDKGKKRKAPVLSAFASGVPEEPKEERDFVTSVAGGTIESKSKKAKTGPLVIPLIANPFADKLKEADGDVEVAGGATPKVHRNGEKNEVVATDKKGSPTGGADDDKYSEAARAIIEDLHRTDEKDSTKFVITSGKGLHVKDEKADTATDAAVVGVDLQGGNDDASAKKKQPILIANMVPGLDKLDDPKEKFMHDMSMRADDQDPNGGRYEAVPVNLFGEAALRGMGWTGSLEDTKFAAPEARPGRLGLGATPKPPESKKERRPGARKKDGARAEAEERSKAKWEEKRKEKVRESKRGKVFFDIEDMVEVYAGPQKGKRGIIRQTEGVPGLENVRLQLEGKKEVVIVSNKHIDLLSAEALENIPFKKTTLVELNTDADRYFKGKHCDRSAAPLKSKEEQERERKRGKDRDRNRNRDRDRERNGDRDRNKNVRAKSSSSRSDLQYTAGEETDHQWVVPMARVRIISQKIGQGKYFKKKGVIQDVVSHKVCLLKMDDTGKILEDVKQSLLETVIPSVGKQIIVVSRGNLYHNATGKLLEKNVKKEKAYVQLDDVPDVQKFMLDEISEYIG